MLELCRSPKKIIEVLSVIIMMFIFSVAVITLATLSKCNTAFINSEPQFTIQAQSNKAFDESCLIDTFNIRKWKHRRMLGTLSEELRLSIFSSLWE